MVSHRVARRLLLWLLPRHGREFIVGDIDEEFETFVRPRMSTAAARRWYWIQALSSLASARRHRRARRAAPERHRGPTLIHQVLSDLRFAFRTYRSAPTFLVATTTTIMLGVGATTAILAVADAVLWRPLPYPDDERITLVGATFPNGRLAPISPPMFFDWQEQNGVFEAMAGVYRHRMDLTGRSEPVRLEAAGVSSELADVLTLRTQRGRWFEPDEDAPGAPRVVVLSDTAWRNLWAADSSVIGLTVVLNEEPWTVIGVLPRDFHPPEYLGLADTQIWFPLSFIPEDLSSHANWFIRVLGKLRSGVSITAAKAEMQALSDRLRTNYPGTLLNEHPDVHVRSLRAETTGDSATTILMLLGAVLVLLLIACANVANLVLARAHDRRREVALRLALGAGRNRILRQLVTESLFLSLVGGAAGLGLSIFAVRSFIRFNPGDWPRLEEIGVDLRVAGFALVVTVVTGLLFGIGPALSASRTDSPSTVAGGRLDPGSGKTNNRFRLTIAGAQTAMALVLLIGAGLLMNSFVRLQMVEPGFTSEDVSVMRISLATKYETREQRLQMFESVLENLRSMPVVSDAGFSSGLPFGGGGMMGSYVVDGLSTATTGTRYVPWQLVSTRYFETLGISPLPGGREFTASELRAGGNVVMVNDRFAREHWPQENAVGKRIKVIRTSENDPWLTIVGVLPDVKQRALAQPSLPEVFVPYSQPPFLLPDMDFVVRAAVPLAALGPAMRQAVWNLDEDQPIDWQATMSDRIQTSVVQPRFYLVMVSAFAATAVLLAVSGIYAVVTYTVEQRRREVGIRLALGGSTVRVLGPLVRQTTAVVAVGLAAGVAVAIVTSRALTGLLYEVTPLDFLTFAGAAVLLGLTGLVAGILPAHRATKIGIAQTLRID